MSTANSAAASNGLPGNKQQIPAAGLSQALSNIWLWPPLVMVALFWIFIFGVADSLEMSMFGKFISRMGMYALLLLGFLIWWLSRRRIAWTDRLLGVAALIGGAILAAIVADRSMGDVFGMRLFSLFLAGLPCVVTAWVVALLVIKFVPIPTVPALARVGMCGVMLLTWGFFDLLRSAGLEGNQHAEFHWRWSPTAEEQFLAARSKSNAEQGGKHADGLAAPAALQLADGDWPEFRGPQRDNQIHGVKIATDWQQHAPKELWRHRVGPGWSSMAIIGNRLFTQEQRGGKEVVVCYDADTGEEIWVHEDELRFYEQLAGPGPRATPTFSDGRIYTLGATGQLNCLDAATGKTIWQRDILAAADAGIPQWGFSGSPLVIDGLVIVFAGGEHDKGLLAYRTSDGKLTWAKPTGKDGYSSPQLASLGGAIQLLMHSSGGLVAVGPEDGKPLWQLPATGMVMPITQPQPVGDSQLLTQSESGIQLVKLTQDADRWSPAQRWDSNKLKPSLNDYVVHDGCIYGFDDGVFCCVDLETGKRLWKAGRYGHGQVLLLADQPLLVVMSEAGEAVLIAPNKNKLDELAKCKIIEGKTWNHPVIAHNRLYARNGEEMACFELAPADAVPGNAASTNN